MKGADHPYVKAGQTIIDLTHEVSHGFSAEQLLDSSTAFEAMLDIRNRVEYARRLDWVSSDAEDAISIANVQDRIETALVEFDEQASIYGADNNTPQYQLSVKPKISEVLKDWLRSSNVGRQKTINTYGSHVKRVISFCGDKNVDVISKVDANRYVQHLVGTGLAHSTIETSVAAMRGLLNFAEEQGYVEENNFAGLRLRGKGKAPKRRVPFSQKQLKKLFELPIKPRERLCLKILALTGMRLDEVALLKFEDIKKDDDTNIRFFDLTDEGKLLKNDQASRRQVPIPDCLVLPKTGQGRLFDYPTDVDGKSQNAASKALLRHIKSVRTTPDQNLVVHSLRHTYKDMLRNAGVPKDLQDFLLGHSPSSVGESYGQGYSLSVKKTAIEQLDFSFIL